MNENIEEKEYLLNDKIENGLSKENGGNVKKAEVTNMLDNELTKQKLISNFNIYQNDEIIENNTLKFKLEEIICPKCEESCKIDFYDYQISLYGCKNNHKINNIFLKEYEYTQIKNKEYKNNLICDNCKALINKEDYICTNCNKKLCFLCQLIHDKSHNFMKYEDINYICPIHNKSYTSYCKTCEKDLCESCVENCDDHELINFYDLIPNKYNLKNKNNELRIAIDKFKNYIQNIIDLLNNVINNFELYYNISHDFIIAFDHSKLNYKLLENINKIYQTNNNYLQILNNLNKYDTFEKKFKTINDIYSKMNVKKTNEITIKYKINKKDKEIKIFGEEFVKNNINHCKIIYKDKYYDLQDKFKIQNIKSNILEISLKGIKNITNMRYMFHLCSSLIELPDISKWDTSDIINMGYLFDGCKLLSSLPDISKWETSKVEYMENIFCKCSSLQYLPDISKWDMSNVIEMSGMFKDCSSLKRLPDISNWNTSKAFSMAHLFDGCSSLINLPNISKWDTSKVYFMDYMFRGCKSLIGLGDLSKWNIQKFTNIENMFVGCNKYLNVPDKLKYKWYKNLI